MTEISTILPQPRPFLVMSSHFKKLLTALKLNNSQAAAVFAVTPGYISKLTTGERQVSRQFADKIRAVYPNVSLDFLLNGNGSIFLDGSNDGSDAVNSGQSSVPITGATTPRATFVPFVELEAQAGYAMQIGDSVFMSRLPKKAIYADGIKEGDFAWQITGDSMEPVFMDGDIVLCSGHDLIHDLAMISNKSYYIIVATDTDGSNWSGAMLKKVAIKGDTVELMSLNKDVPVIKLPAAKLKHVYKVKKLVDRVL